MPLSGIFQEPPQKSKPVHAHVSLFPRYVSCSSKLNATNKNTGAEAELFALTRKKGLKFG